MLTAKQKARLLRLKYLGKSLVAFYSQCANTMFMFGRSLDKNLNWQDIHKYKNKKSIENIEDLPENMISLDTAIDFYSFMLNRFPLVLNLLRKVDSSNQRKYRRLKEKITIMLDKPCLFLTMTFSDKILMSTTEETRRRYIKYFLESFNVPAICNIDYGGKHDYIDRQGNTRTATNREHFHAVIQLPRIDLTLYKYGFIFAEKIIKSDDYGAMAKYISKLTNHAVKVSTKRRAIMYIRNNNL